jgi:hypothetical protein
MSRPPTSADGLPETKSSPSKQLSQKAEKCGDTDVLSRTAIRWLGVYEHPLWLDDAVTNSRHRLLLIAPWITRAVVSTQWVRRLERLADVADVTVFWGYGDNRRTDPDAVADLHAAAGRSDRLAIVKVGDTHAKVLVSDRYYIKTSFNWLSFRGDPSREYRQEEGDLVQDEVLADRAYDKYMSESCALAREVVGTLPAKYAGLVGSGATRPTGMKVSPSAPSGWSRPQQTRSIPEKSKDALRRFCVGQTLSGTVKSMTNYGIFVNLGDVDGLIHISRLAPRRITHPSEVVRVGETVTVTVVEVDIERGRLSLALETPDT